VREKSIVAVGVVGEAVVAVVVVVAVGVCKQ
jgi:hypothetical protein